MWLVFLLTTATASGLPLVQDMSILIKPASCAPWNSVRVATAAHSLGMPCQHFILDVTLDKTAATYQSIRAETLIYSSTDRKLTNNYFDNRLAFICSHYFRQMSSKIPIAYIPLFRCLVIFYMIANWNVSICVYYEQSPLIKYEPMFIFSILLAMLLHKFN